MHRKLFTMSDASVGLDDLFQNTELTKFRERKVTSYLLNLRVFPLGTFYVFFSTCNNPPCLLEQDGVVVPGSYRTPVVIEFSSAGTQYGELGGSMHVTNISFSHEDPHDLAILILDPGQDSVYKDDPLTISFPEVDFTNLTFVGMASYAFVNWTIDNSESHPIILIMSPSVLPSGVVDRLDEDEETLLPNISSVCTESALYGKFCDWVLGPKVDLMEVLCQPSDRCPKQIALPFFS